MSDERQRQRKCDGIGSLRSREGAGRLKRDNGQAVVDVTDQRDNNVVKSGDLLLTGQVEARNSSPHPAGRPT